MLKKNRIYIYVHHDVDNIVDNHVFYTLRKLKELGGRIIFIHNNINLDVIYRDKIKSIASLYLRHDTGRDWGGWKEFLLKEKRSIIEKYEEVILLNSSVYGPLFPLLPIFEKMDSEKCDFWTPTQWANYIPNHLDVAPHFQPYFLVIKKQLFNSDYFWMFWEGFDENQSNYWDLVINGEVELTLHLERNGFIGKAYASNYSKEPLDDLGYNEPFSQNGIDVLIRNCKVPFLKIKSFAYNHHRPYSISREIFDALLDSRSNYPINLIDDHLNRTQALSNIKSLPDTTIILEDDTLYKAKNTKVAVFAHIYYFDDIKDTINEILQLPVPFDLYISCANIKSKNKIIDILNIDDKNCNFFKIIINKNRGRDIYPWLILAKKFSFKYDLALKIHAKRHGQQPSVFGERWKRYLLDNLVGTEAQILNIMKIFHDNPKVGICFPPYPPYFLLLAPNAFRGSPDDIKNFDGVFKRIEQTKNNEPSSYLFSVGTMFWFRPEALKTLVDNENLKFKDFPKEPIRNKSTIAHGLERAIPYIVQSNGYQVKLIITKSWLLKSFFIYEDRLMSMYFSDFDKYKYFFNKIHIWKKGFKLSLIKKKILQLLKIR
jgi:lipopolysaccharide biosynthesis protein